MSHVWHYTIADYLPSICGYGILLGSNAGAPDERPMLWFSENQHFEPTAAKLAVTPGGRMITVSFDELASRGHAIRFGLPCDDKRLLNWRDACRFAGTSKRLREAMERAGIQQGANPEHWLASSGPIEVAELMFQAYRDGQWQPVTLPANGRLP